MSSGFISGSRQDKISQKLKELNEQQCSSPKESTPSIQQEPLPEYPKIARGLDGKLFLVFTSSFEADLFLDSVKAPIIGRVFHHFGQYENAIELVTEPLNIGLPKTGFGMG